MRRQITVWSGKVSQDGVHTPQLLNHGLGLGLGLHILGPCFEHLGTGEKNDAEKRNRNGRRLLTGH